jgi:uncharacterized cupredoxin-like copper-binding protein
MRTRTLSAGIAAALALVTAACGSGDTENASSDSGGSRRVEVAMVDFDFKPETLAVAKGEEVQFAFTNDGKVRHEAYFGSLEDQADHEKEMAEAGEESGGHDAHGGGRGNSKITVEPGKSGDLTYRFNEAGTYEIGCHEPGHYAAGMKITVTVT